MKWRGNPILVWLLATWLSGQNGLAAAEKPRLIVLTDIGGDPDDQQSMIRLMLYANEYEIEGLIASAAGTPGELKAESVRPELIREIVDAYGQVRENLLLHAADYPSKQFLLERIKAGNPRRGIANVGDGKDTAGSNWIIHTVDRQDDRHVHISIWGGSTELAQALWRVRNDRSGDELKRFLKKIRVYAINHQDDTGPWIMEQFPDLFYILSRQPEGQDKRESAYRGMYLGGDESLTSRAWVDRNIRLNHGPLGALYPLKTWTEPNPHGVLKEGDTPSWFYFLPNGLGDVEHPEYGSWGGRFRTDGRNHFRDAQDTVGNVSDARATVWRWRPAFQADFQARLDWCVKPYGLANHAPHAVVNGDSSRQIVVRHSPVTAPVKLDGSGSNDPDGQPLRFKWWHYREASTFTGEVTIAGQNSPVAGISVPASAAGKTSHMIVEAIDNGEPPLTSYRRIIVNWSPAP